MSLVTRAAGGLLVVLAAGGSSLACQPAPAPPPAPAAAGLPMLEALAALAADSMEGRATGTPGGERARRFLLAELRAIGVDPVGARYEHPFEFTRQEATVHGVNLLALVRGTATPDRYLVITAHYDHVGIRQGSTYNGADDNASGAAALLELARRLKALPLRHSVILALVDAEEMGLRGAAAFVASPPVPKDAIVMNLNMDMISRSTEGVLWAAGATHYPQFKPLLESVAATAPVTLKLGHDTPGAKPGDDWTFSSDHGPFHRAGIPFIYFGVEDHAGYHDPSDDVAVITPEFYGRAVETIWRVLRAVDAR